MTAIDNHLYKCFPEKRRALELLIETKKFNSENDVHKLMLLFALQINELSIGFEKLTELANEDGNPFQQANWILLRAIFEATVKIKYLCHSINKSPERCSELLQDADKDQLKSLKAMMDAFPNNPNAEPALKILELRKSLTKSITALKMEDRCKAVFSEDQAEQLVMLWHELCAHGHSRPTELERNYTNGNGGYKLYSQVESVNPNYLTEMAFHFVRFACECLERLDNKS